MRDSTIGMNGWMSVTQSEECQKTLLNQKTGFPELSWRLWIFRIYCFICCATVIPPLCVLFVDRLAGIGSGGGRPPGGRICTGTDSGTAADAKKYRNHKLNAV